MTGLSSSSRAAIISTAVVLVAIAAIVITFLLFRRYRQQQQESRATSTEPPSYISRLSTLSTTFHKPDQIVHEIDGQEKRKPQPIDPVELPARGRFSSSTVDSSSEVEFWGM